MKFLKTIFCVGTISVMSSLGFVFAAPARADLILCNKAASKYLAAVTWKAPGNSVRSSGWIQIQPGKCQKAGFSGDTSNAEFGVYGENIAGGFHTGDTPRCVIQFPTQRSWTVDRADEASLCKGAGRRMVSFRLFRTTGSAPGPDQYYSLFD